MRHFLSYLTGVMLVGVMLFAEVAGAQCPCSGTSATLTGSFRVSQNPGVSFDTESLCLDGTLIIDVNTVLSNCTIIGATPNAKIIVENGKTLTVQSSSLLRGCNDKWKGVEVMIGGKVIVTNSTIQNADVGLLLHTGSVQSEVKSSFFKDNAVGIQVGDYGGFNPAMVSPFSGNSFTVLATGNVQTLRAGLQLNAVASAIIAANSNNKFTRVPMGIESISSNLTILDGIFSDNRKMTPNDQITGYGISSRLFGTLTVSSCDFIGCHSGGVLSNGDNVLNVFGSNFTECKEFGINGQGMFFYGSVNINSNTFAMNQTSERSAIYFLRPYELLGTHNRISDNTINASGVKSLTTLRFIAVQSGLGFSVGGFGVSQSNGLLRINGNTINNTATSSAQFPINMSGIAITGFGGFGDNKANGFHINDNHVNFQQGGAVKTGPHHGIDISFTEGTDNFVSGNFITANYSHNGNIQHSGLLCGVHMDISKGWNICTNDIDGAIWGIHTVGNSVGSQLEGNILQSGMIGYFSQSSKLGMQVLQNNLWAGPYSFLGAQNGKQDIAANGEFTMTTDISPKFQFFELMADFPPTFEPPIWFQQWFDEPSTDDCTGAFAPPNNPCWLDLQDQQLINGTAVAETPARDWDAKRELLNRLMNCPQLRPSGSAAAAFYANNQNSSAWAFMLAEKSIANAYAALQSGSSQAATEMSNWHILNGQILALELLQNNSPSFDQSIFSAEQALIVQAQTARNAWKTQVDALQTNVQAAILSAETEVSNLSAATIYEINRKTILLKAIKGAKGIAPSEADMQAVRAIAQQCPAEGGEIVKLASVLLPFEERGNYDDEGFFNHNCPNAGNREGKSIQTALQKDGILVYPNPSNRAFNVVVPKELGASNWELINSQGQICRTGTFGEHVENAEIEASNLPVGIYVLKILAQTGVAQTITVSIIK